MSCCCVLICKNNFRNNKNVKFHRFPMYKRQDSMIRKRLTLRQRMEWIRRLQNVSSMTIENIENKRVCSDHFKLGEKADSEDILNVDWIPWRHLKESNDDWSDAINPSANDYVDCEFDCVPQEKRTDDRLEFDESVITTETADIRDLSSKLENCMGSLNKIRDEVLNETKVSELKAVIDGLFKVIELLQQKLNSYKIDLDFFKNDDKKTAYYTGLPKYVMLETLIAKLAPFVDRNGCKLSASQMIILTLMKLRLGLHFTDLGYRFNVSRQTASRTFFSCIQVMYFKMKGMVYRPPKEEVAKTMPQCFQNNFGEQVAHIIDCVELFIEAPYHFDTRIQCWSEYKHHYTIKYLVSITPQGMFEFISKGYGGRANDMLITTTCNFLDILQPNDLVLADKGFNMHDVFKMRCVDLEIPAFVSNQNQLHPLDVEATRKIANVRIHVERCIGLLRRKYLILHRVIPLTMLSKPLSATDKVPVMDKIITVCSALCNLCPTIISDEKLKLF